MQVVSGSTHQQKLVICKDPDALDGLDLDVLQFAYHTKMECASKKVVLADRTADARLQKVVMQNENQSIRFLSCELRCESIYFGYRGIYSKQYPGT
jgi:hypothetical protein